jgi:hypothetical protein
MVYLCVLDRTEGRACPKASAPGFRATGGAGGAEAPRALARRWEGAPAPRRRGGAGLLGPGRRITPPRGERVPGGPPSAVARLFRTARAARPRRARPQKGCRGICNSERHSRRRQERRSARSNAAAALTGRAAESGPAGRGRGLEAGHRRPRACPLTWGQPGSGRGRASRWPAAVGRQRDARRRRRRGGAAGGGRGAGARAGRRGAAGGRGGHGPRRPKGKRGRGPLGGTPGLGALPRPQRGMKIRAPLWRPAAPPPPPFRDAFGCSPGHRDGRVDRAPGRPLRRREGRFGSQMPRHGRGRAAGAPRGPQLRQLPRWRESPAPAPLGVGWEGGRAVLPGPPLSLGAGRPGRPPRRRAAAPPRRRAAAAAAAAPNAIGAPAQPHSSPRHRQGRPGPWSIAMTPLRGRGQPTPRAVAPFPKGYPGTSAPFRAVQARPPPPRADRAPGTRPRRAAAPAAAEMQLNAARALHARAGAPRRPVAAAVRLRARATAARAPCSVYERLIVALPPQATERRVPGHVRAAPRWVGTRGAAGCPASAPPPRAVGTLTRSRSFAQVGGGGQRCGHGRGGRRARGEACVLRRGGGRRRRWGWGRQGPRHTLGGWIAPPAGRWRRPGRQPPLRPPSALMLAIIFPRAAAAPSPSRCPPRPRRQPSTATAPRTPPSCSSARRRAPPRRGRRARRAAAAAAAAARTTATMRASRCRRSARRACSCG